jgi:hypothetical protein
MAKRKQSELQSLLVTLRRTIVLAVAAFGLWREISYEALILRLAILWAVLYLSSGVIELVFQYLSSRANRVVIARTGDGMAGTQAAVEKTGASPAQ